MAAAANTPQGLISPADAAAAPSSVAIGPSTNTNSPRRMYVQMPSSGSCPLLRVTIRLCNI